ncbi:hypothetical protein [Fibrobacter sp.]|uniref:hypothetical protein n=1 Tax=Fibrobacter sp. TaxID=35828 RepID=UPI00388E8B7A
MIDFIIKLEDALRLAGHEDYEIRYLPEVDVYSLTLDGEKVFLMPNRIAEKEFGKENLK